MNFRPWASAWRRIHSQGSGSVIPEPSLLEGFWGFGFRGLGFRVSGFRVKVPYGKDQGRY